MKRIDLWLDDPIDINGENGTCYYGVNHISTINANDCYVESVDGEILYFNEMDETMIAEVGRIIDNHSEQVVIVKANRDDYKVDQIGTMTIGELADYLLNNFDRDRKVFMSFDGGYTFGGFRSDDIVERDKNDL